MSVLLKETALQEEQQQLLSSDVVRFVNYAE
jgi:hypothetical protein